MDPAFVVFLLGVLIAIIAIAGHLIAIILILKHVVNRLNTILGAVQAVTKTSQPVEALVGDINADLDAGRKLMEDCVARLEASAAPPTGAAPEPARHAQDRHAASNGPGGGTATVAPPARAETERAADTEGQPPEEEWPPRERPSPNPPPSPLWNRNR
ncbi:MAG: hypothetical protein MSC31_11845 [Solirubrobacteraceae bacterium MAG38_C4-C5]|nr:hypothetical protein [Candidatus Siliceabacter maunaloa]